MALVLYVYIDNGETHCQRAVEDVSEADLIANSIMAKGLCVDAPATERTRAGVGKLMAVFIPPHRVKKIELIDDEL